MSLYVWSVCLLSFFIIFARNLEMQIKKYDNTLKLIKQERTFEVKSNIQLTIIK